MPRKGIGSARLADSDTINTISLSLTNSGSELSEPFSRHTLYNTTIIMIITNNLILMACLELEVLIVLGDLVVGLVVEEQHLVVLAVQQRQDLVTTPVPPTARRVGSISWHKNVCALCVRQFPFQCRMRIQLNINNFYRQCKNHFSY